MSPKSASRLANPDSEVSAVSSSPILVIGFLEHSCVLLWSYCSGLHSARCPAEWVQQALGSLQGQDFTTHSFSQCCLSLGGCLIRYHRLGSQVYQLTFKAQYSEGWNVISKCWYQGGERGGGGQSAALPSNVVIASVLCFYGCVHPCPCVQHACQ